MYRTPMDRVPVSEAAARLGVTPDAVRQRIRRGTIQYEKTDEGRYYVFLTPHDGRRDGVQDGVQKALVERLYDENEWLRREVERKDTIIMSLSQSIAALEAPREPQEAPETGSPTFTGVDVEEPTQEPEKRSSWWRRVFGA